MSVLVKGMEMSTSCRACLYSRTDIRNWAEKHWFHVDWCVLTEKDLPCDCPLIPVPPHGRLIDADEFLKRAIGTKCFRGDYALMLEELVGESTAIIPA